MKWRGPCICNNLKLTHMHVHAWFHKLIQLVVDKPGVLPGMVIGFVLFCIYSSISVFQYPYRLEKAQAGRYLVTSARCRYRKVVLPYVNMEELTWGYWATGTNNLSLHPSASAGSHFSVSPPSSTTCEISTFSFWNSFQALRPRKDRPIHPDKIECFVYPPRARCCG
jgi:hypothetical protein